MKINGCAQLLSSFNAIPRPMLYGSAASTRPPPSHLHPAHAALSRAGFETQRLQKSSAASFPPACLPRTRAALASRRPNPPRAAAPRAALAARRLNPPCTAAPSCGLRPPPPERGVRARLASRERALRRRLAPAGSGRSRRNVGSDAPRLPRTRPALQPHPAGSDRRRRDPCRGVRTPATAAGTCAGCGLGLRRHLFGIFGSIFGDFSFFTLEAKSREICFRKLLLGHL